MEGCAQTAAASRVRRGENESGQSAAAASSTRRERMKYTVVEYSVTAGLYVSWRTVTAAAYFVASAPDFPCLSSVCGDCRFPVGAGVVVPLALMNIVIVTKCHMLLCALCLHLESGISFGRVGRDLPAGKSHGLEIGMYLKSQYQCGCYLPAVCIDRSPLLFVGFSRSLLECIESCMYVT